MISGLLDELAQIKDSDAAASEEDVAQSAAASAYAGRPYLNLIPYNIYECCLFQREWIL